MQFTRTEITFFYVALCLIYVLNWQLHFYGWDISWGVHEARRLLVGGTFGNDFFETTPPMYLYLYSIPVLISKALAIKDIIPVFQVFILALASLSLFTCYFFVKQLCAPQNKFILAALMLAIAAVFLLLPLPFDLGQREHLLVIFIMPYCFLMALRLQDYQVERSLLILAGVLAAIGFSIKPFFVLTFACIELYGMCYKKHFFAWVRLESVIIITFLLFYSVLICVFYTNYFYMLQLAMDFYYQGMGFPWNEMIMVPSVFFCYLAILLYLIQYKSSQYKVLGAILSIATITLLAAYFLQHTSWYYHALPAYSFALVLTVLMTVELLGQKDLTVRNYILLSFLSVISIGFGYFKYRLVATSLILSPENFFGFFSILFLFAFCLAQRQQNFYKALACTLLVMAIGFWVTYMLQQSMYVPHRFALTVFFLLLLFGLFMREEKRAQVIFATIVAMLLLVFPVYNVYFRTWMASDYKTEVNRLSAFMNKYAKHQSVQFFSTTMCFEFPAIDYAEVLPASRYAFFVWMPGLVKLGLLSGENKVYSPLIGDKNYLLDSVTEDLNLRKPALVFVDIKDDKANMRGLKFEYLPIFLQNKSFQQAWKPYEYLTTFEKANLYKYAVYKRRDV